MIEQNDFMASDALRLAVDLHVGLEKGIPACQSVLYTAEAFYEWLKDKQE